MNNPVLVVQFSGIWPAVAFALAAGTVVAGLFRVLTAGSVPRPRPQVHRDPLLLMLFALVALVVEGGFYMHAQSDLAAYRNDPSCTELAVEPGAGACRFDVVQIVHAYSSGTKSRSYHLQLERADGTNDDVVIPYNAVWSGVRYRGDHSAKVQFFRNRIVSVATTSGYSHTNDMPADAMDRYFLLGMLTGGVGLIAAVARAMQRS
ncbi:hypothetical protein WPS_17380 [Vulcanimicrobium alpinum]|uniref:Uncharacterized protein n=1 Tax=Vulcanimicrobium alpinum TaxID=3016050 RepID=A0AAN2CAA5_UNVUL|nr:hypothetical protein [Vulcanimicrobium alpinum]BDE06462.1 hypothetical protein WPS_17380 [Vulcanimicrobium alpinum]